MVLWRNYKQNLNIMNRLVFIIALTLVACSINVKSPVKNFDIMHAITKGEQVQLVNIVIEDAIDFTKLLKQVSIGESITNGNCISSISFVGCTFLKPIIAYSETAGDVNHITTFRANVSFVNCLFEEPVNFRSSVFFGKVDFGKSIFRKGANFEDMTCMQSVNYRSSVMNGEIRFQNARFFHKSNFMDLIVEDNISFQSAKFNDETNFSMMKASKYVDFSLTAFEGNASFNYIKWSGRSTFNNAYFNRNISFVNPTFGMVHFTNVDSRGKFNMKNEKITDEANSILISK